MPEQSVILDIFLCSRDKYALRNSQTVIRCRHGVCPLKLGYDLEILLGHIIRGYEYRLCLP